MTPRAPRAWAAALLVALAPGCIVPALGTKRTGRRVSAGDARAVAASRLSKGELLDRLGPPMAIAARGEHVRVPAANVHHVDEMGHRALYFGGDSWAQQADAWFEPFAARRPIREAHRVYYWYATSEGGIAFFLLFGFSSRWSSTSELWVLVDEEAGRVEDAFFLER